MATNKGVWIKTWAVALFVSFLVTACGGGDGADRQAQTAAVAGPSASNSTGHNAADAVAAAGQRHQALAVRTPDATALFDWAERACPQFFPSHRANSLFDPYTFRYYPENGNYIAVAGSSVVVLGPVTAGKIVNVGVLSDFAFQVYPSDCSPAPGPGGANNGCFDLALFDTAGTHVVVTSENFFTFQKMRTTSGTQTIDATVGNVTGFEGYAQARETSIILTITPPAPGTGFENRSKAYNQRTGDAEFTGYGSTSSTRTLIGTSVVSKSVWSPPLVDRKSSLALGESYTTTTTITTTNTTSGIPGQPESSSTTSSTSTSTFKFVGRETVTVPAGTYSTCRFEGTTSTSTSAGSLWFIDGKGILVKYETGDGAGGTASQLATFIELNGQKI